MAHANHTIDLIELLHDAIFVLEHIDEQFSFIEQINESHRETLRWTEDEQERDYINAKIKDNEEEIKLLNNKVHEILRELKNEISNY